MQWLKQFKPRQWLGGVLALAAAGLTVVITFLGSQTKPPTSATQAVLAFFAICAQVGSVWAFSGVGKADPGLAERSVAHLYKLAARASAAKDLAELSTERQYALVALRKVIGELSVHLSYLEEGYIDAIDDWRIFHPDAVARAENGTQKGIKEKS